MGQQTRWTAQRDFKPGPAREFKQWAKRCTLGLAITAMAALAGTNPAFSQTTRAEIQGKVTDSTGAVVSGAQVTVLETGTGVATHTASNSAGEFALPFLTPGHYEVDVEMQGFSPYKET